jgi:hypothetical protein
VMDEIKSHLWDDTFMRWHIYEMTQAQFLCVVRVRFSNSKLAQL